MWQLDYSDASGVLLFDDLTPKHLHSCPMHLWSEMMLSVIAVKEPNPVVKLIVTAYAPGERLVRVTAIVAVVSVEV